MPDTHVDRSARRWGWLLIALAVLVVYWPLSTFNYCVTDGDTLDCWLPWRWFIASSLQAGHAPLWNPLQQMGYPIYADLQGPSWYVEALALGGTVGHSILVLQTLYLAYIIIGGVGCWRLLRVVHGDERVAFIAGAAYALCGFFTGHQMHFYSVISGAWMPWLLAAQLRLMRTPHWRIALEASLFQFLLLTGGNHTFTIIAAYLLVALSVVHAVRAWRAGDHAYMRRLFAQQVLFVLVNGVLACGTLYAWWEVQPFLDRAAGLSYVNASDRPFTLHAAISLFFPYAAGTDQVHLGTDPTMANGYIGALTLVFALLAFLRKRSAIENTFLFFGAICALASFGAALPVHKWLWSFAPGMDLFRFPSYFGWFTMIAALMLAAGSLREDAVWIVPRKRALLAVLSVTLIVVCALMLRAWIAHVWEPSFHSQDPLFDRLRAMGHAHRMLLSGSVTFPVLLAAILLAWRDRLRMRWILALVLIEMGWNTQLAQWNTAVSDFDPAALNTRMHAFACGPMLPTMTPMGANIDGSADLHFLWRNTQDITGRPTHDGFNSFWLNDANRLEGENAALWKAMKRQPIVYLSDRVINAHDYDAASIDPATDSAVVVLPDNAQIPVGLRRSLDDRIAFTSFDFNAFGLKTRTRSLTFLRVQQSWYPGWKIHIDGRPVIVQRANIAAFGAFVPAGDHVIDVRFEKPIVHILLAISLITFILLLAVLCITSQGSARVFGSTGTIVIASMLGWSLLAHSSRNAGDRAISIPPPALVPLASDDRVVFADAFDQPIALSATNPYTKAFRVSAEKLRDGTARALIVDLQFKANARTKGRIVIERRRNNIITDYEAVPNASPNTNDTAWISAQVVRDIRELRRDDDEVGIYVWNEAVDTLLVRDIRVRTTVRSPVR